MRRPPPAQTAYDLRDRLQWVTGWSDEDLQAIPIFQGEEFVPGEVYFNLDLPERGMFIARGEEFRNPGAHYVAKSQVPPNLWRRLITAWGEDGFLKGALAPHPGAFGQGGPVADSHGGTGATALGIQSDLVTSD